ncbi:hypothetical protein ACJJTC_012052 [Scirpophaga incertulas]
MRRQRTTLDHTNLQQWHLRSKLGLLTFLNHPAAQILSSSLIGRKTCSRRGVGKQGTGKKSVSSKTTDNRVSRPQRRITDAARCTEPNEIAVFFSATAPRRQTRDANSC